MAKLILMIVLLCASASLSTMAMSVRPPVLDEIGKIASKPCSDVDSGGYEPSPAMKDAMTTASEDSSEDTVLLLLADLQNKRQEIQNLTGTIYNQFYNNWASPFFIGPTPSKVDQFRNVVGQNLLIPQNTSATEEENRIHTLIQFASFVYFLKSQQKEKVYGENKSAERQELRIKIRQAACIIRRLLPDVYNEDIEVLVNQKVQVNLASKMETASSGMRRIIFTLAIETILNTFNNLEISTENLSVSISQWL